MIPMPPPPDGGVTLLEIVGYVSSVLIAVSLMMSNIYKLRVINFIGAFAFAVYGAFIPAIPVAVVNGFIAVIDVYYLWQLSRRKEYYRTFEIAHTAPFLRHFLQFRERDIQKFFPDFSWEKEMKKAPSCFFLLRDTNPTGVFVYQIKKKAVIVKLDYVIPEYRDMKNARYLFMVLNERFRSEGLREYVVEGVHVETHRKYLTAIGFEADERDPAIMRMPI
ncbi:MAG TPA: hypothetical protein PLM00_00535 [Spirochaetota bacterium]|nr:hypothetical protein [Spirochaetota bacterium]